MATLARVVKTNVAEVKKVVAGICAFEDLMSFWRLEKKASADKLLALKEEKKMLFKRIKGLELAQAKAFRQDNKEAACGATKELKAVKETLSVVFNLIKQTETRMNQAHSWLANN